MQILQLCHRWLIQASTGPGFSLASLALAILALSACSSDNGNDAKPTTTVNWEFGLDGRPDNGSCIAPPTPGNAGDNFELYNPFADLPAVSSPLGLYQMPGDTTQFYVMERLGTLRLFANDAVVNSHSLVLNISSKVSTFSFEGGLLGMAFHPNVASNHTVYLSYTTTGPNRSVISRFTLSNDFTSIDPASEAVVLELTQPAGNHNGGNIQFGPDGYLYIGFGDGGTAFRAQSQETDNFYGALLRIDVDPTASSDPYYTVPADNPFVGDATFAPEIFAYGLRNPWRWSFDQLTGQLWLGDVGDGTYEEINLVTGGENFGWPVMEGMNCVSAGCDQSPYTLPIEAYEHNSGRCSITGGYVYRGSEISGLDGSYVYSDYCTGEVWVLRDEGGSYSVTPLTDAPSVVPAMAQDNNGEIYLLTGSTIRKLRAINPGTSNIPAQLSLSGCFSASDPRQANAGLIPYSLIAPLWSDGAEKQRFVAIPNGTAVTIDADLDFSFPVGTVLAKHFMHNDTYIETRLLMHHQSGWAGYSYEWNAAQTDAMLLSDAKDVSVAGLDWHFPSGPECRLCHTQQKDFALGPELHQLNQDFSYPSTSRSANQIDTLNEIGYFSSPPPAGSESLMLYALDDSSASLEQRAKSYLHSNCSQCHSPGGIGAGPIDLRFTTALADMEICGIDPLNDLGITNAKLLAPGEPGLSIILERMQRLDGNRMPPLASSVVDSEAVTLISDWISSLSSCP